ncbi:MAG: phosphate ABC transporter, permease protein PstA [Micrococcales bacterium 73-13]|mgnify:CR=1 FL=1|nr:MAG: phosphate ABC transporter, permease protein PstA [Micrococcales bacterium 73-13]
MAVATASRRTAVPNRLTHGRLPKWAPWTILIGCWAVMSAIVGLVGAASGAAGFDIALAIFLGQILFLVAIWVIAYLVEGGRQAKDRFVTGLVATAFVIALLPLVSLAYTVVVNGAARFDVAFFTESMRNVVGEGGGALHAIVGTLIITGLAALISVPVGLLTAVYLVEYGRGWLARAITFFVDVMTGIPSIVAGLFAFAMFALITGNAGYRSGIGGAIALSLLMIPVVVRSSEEMLRIVPNELREASYALGVPKYATILRIVIPTAIAGIATGVTIAIARVIGETAPLLIVAGFTTSMNYDPFSGRMSTLPVFVYTQYMNPGADLAAYTERAWAGALVLILIVMVLNLVARLIAKLFAPKTGR